ncbi:MAG: thiamine-phosphate kinase [Flavobacteriales bacterium]|nr:thiamine-phosphate kinase [Flavobacteriales bacterium]MCB9196288.1 thiamine-phosphate kinase [Flavobacteriales bacterium]
MAEKYNQLKDLGEFKLIEYLTQNVKIHHSSTLKGIGDDAAVIDHENRKTVVSTDMLVEGVHFDMVFTPLKHLGYKAVAVNLSDIYAMNAQPRQITVSLAISSKYSVEAIADIYEGMIHAANFYGVDIIGGDTTSSLKGLIISITALGEAKEEDIVYRNGAKEHDLLVVSGDLGGAYAGLNLLQREKEVWKVNPNMQPELEGYDYVLERQLKPEARKDVIQFLSELGVKPSSMIDVSDGLASEIHHICKQSNLGCSLYEEKIPIDPMTYKVVREFDMDPTVCALSGGEDYELLFTISQSDFDKIKGNPHWTVIGHMTDASHGVNLITSGGSVTPLKAQGWNSFDDQDKD